MRLFPASHEEFITTPHFVAISNHGMINRWYAWVNMLSFKEEATRHLKDFLDHGLWWDVCVVFKEDLKRATFDKHFFRIKFTYQDFLKESKTKYIRFIRRHLIKMFSLRIRRCKSKKELDNLFNTYPDKVRWIIKRKLASLLGVSLPHMPKRNLNQSMKQASQNI